MDPENSDVEYHWQRLVDKFALQKSGANPWDANQLAASLPGCSNAERQTILFLLNVWDPGGEWPDKFDFIEAFRSWDDKNIRAFMGWANDPLWP